MLLDHLHNCFQGFSVGGLHQSDIAASVEMGNQSIGLETIGLRDRSMFPIKPGQGLNFE